MNRRFLTRAVAVTLSLAAAPALMAQSSSIPRTEHGVPDFQGTYTFRTLTPLNRPPELADKATLTEEEAAEWAAFENRRQNRDLIIDSVGGAGYPPGVSSYNEFWYERGVDTIADRRTSLVYARTLNDRCLLNARTGPPMISGSYNNNMQLVQTKDHVMILSEMIHHARIIRFDDEHHTRQLKWEGDSIAHWDGDTLVINTQNYYYPNGWRNTSKAMKVEERFTWLDENTLDYDFTVEDPNTWDVSWSARLPMRRIEDPIYEYACHEGNHGLAGILAGWRRYESMGMNGDGTPKED